MLAPVPTRPRSNPFRRRRGTAPLLVVKGAAAAKLPAESSTSVSSCFHSEVISTSSTSLAAFQRSEKRPRIQGDDEARPAGSECSEVIGGVTARPAEVEASESSCFGSMLESDLACPEKLTDQAEATEYYDLLTPLETEDEVLSAPYRSDDYVLSPLVDLYPPLTPYSDNCHDAVPSATFSIYHAFAKQFVPCLHPRARAATDPTSDLLPGKRFEDLDDEESYQRFRQRERRGVLAFDYTEAYSSLSGSNGRLVGEQRAVMVNWIIEYSNVMKLQPATMFMGIRLMDRFLTRGYIKGLRNLQLLGIACITLATRIEENQPYNCILLKTFKVGFNIYTRSEVVAMEWLVQEVLNFQCLVTTTHHFLWFYLKAAKANEKVEDLAKYLASLSLMDHKQLSFWPSTVAAAVVALACLATNKESSCHLVMETHMRTKDDDLPECLMSLEWLITFASG